MNEHTRESVEQAHKGPLVCDSANWKPYLVHKHVCGLSDAVMDDETRAQAPLAPLRLALRDPINHRESQQSHAGATGSVYISGVYRCWRERNVHEPGRPPLPPGPERPAARKLSRARIRTPSREGER